MSVVRTDRGSSEINLTITIEPEQYQPVFQNELRKFQQKAQIKGFRKGKMPLPVVRKMYGLAILNDVVSDLTQKSLTDYISAEGLKVFDKPIISDEHEPVNINPDNPVPYVFRFIVGLIPQFELQGLDKSFIFKRKKVLISDEKLEDIVKSLQRRHGKGEPVEEGFQDLDTIQIDIRELDGDQIKEDGHQASFSFMLQVVNDPTLVEEIRSKRVGETFRFDVFNFERNTTEAFVRKYLLKLPEDQLDRSIGSMFEATILSATRIFPAPLDAVLFESVFPGENLTDESAFRQKLRDEESNAYLTPATNLLYADLRRHLFERNSFELPQNIIVRQIIEKQNITNPEQIQSVFGQYAGQLVWSLIEQKIKERFDFNLTENDIFGYLGQKVFRYFGTSDIDPATYRKIVGQLAQDDATVREAISTVTLQKVLAHVADQVTIEDELLTEEAFKQELEKLQMHDHDHDHNHDHDHIHDHEHDHDHDHNHDNHDHDHDHEHNHDHDHSEEHEHPDHSHTHQLTLDVSKQEEKSGERHPE